jgi:hypothetical protein
VNTRSDVRFALGEGFCPKWAICNIFSKMARRISDCLAPSVPGQPVKIPRNDPVTNGVTGPAAARTWASDGNFSHSRALRIAVMAWGAQLIGPTPDLATGTPLAPGSANLERLIRRTIRGLHFAYLAAERNGCPQIPVAVDTASCTVSTVSTHPARGLADRPA